ncbi:hypothetical protein CLV40_12721 [Actinokineospora auranticolor]|uniref:Uncharacterized protein n=1 Tax=Actinokineospora auranticolor TaxID=155976 RepID=A0A2S6GE36_9PSEU|nr:hypothetical protein CLV40_12721 [Actinokineospora auranticolor]
MIERFAEALSAPVWEVSQAFFADAGLSLNGGPVLTLEQQRLVDSYALLNPDRQRIADRLIDALVADQADQAAHDGCARASIAQESSVTPDT